ncbi:MAG: DsbA family protein [Acidimicrobiales bacterium]
MTTAVDFWVDPACPWCWNTARWVVDEVAPQRDLEIRWQSISLLMKNQPPEDSPYYEGTLKTLRMLRVMEAIRAAEGDAAISDWYLLCGTRVHHDQTADFDLADALESIGLDRDYAKAADDADTWDPIVRAGQEAGLALTGDDVGTPIIAFTGSDGERRGIFGPVISRIPTGDDALAMWDAMEAFTKVDGFWELKRTRTEGPIFPERLDY